jgi:hypothetical protein
MVKRRFSMVLMGTSMLNQLKKLEKKVKVVGNHHERWRCSILLMGTSSKYVVCSMFLAGICSIEELLGNFCLPCLTRGYDGSTGIQGSVFLSCFKEHRIFLKRICQIRLQFWCLGFRNFGSFNWILFFFEDAQKLGQDGTLSGRNGEGFFARPVDLGLGDQEWSLGIKFHFLLGLKSLFTSLHVDCRSIDPKREHA